VGYLPGMWHDFGVTIGSLAGALTGLLFVAVSIKSETLAKSVSLRSRAAQTLVLFLTSALASIVLVAPQPGDALGGELVALALLAGTALYVFDRRGGHDQTNRVARFVERGSPNTITPAFFGVAGITFLVSAGGGLYWLIPAAVCGLAGGVINAWLFLVRA
jgi:hypothetical protein